MSTQISVNVRYSLWRRRIDRAEWASELARRTGLAESRMSALVHGSLEDSDLTIDEVAVLAEIVGLGHEPDHLRYPLQGLSESDILHENLRFLLNSLGRGGKKTLAADLGIDPTTISRWLNGTSAPHAATLRQLLFYFGLAASVDLNADPVFLSAEPISLAERRKWLEQRIREMDAEDLREMFPALRRLLEKR